MTKAGWIDNLTWKGMMEECGIVKSNTRMNWDASI